MAHFILEIGTEEMPARFLPILDKALEDGFVAKLKELKLGFGSVRPLSTPRRLTLFIEDVATMQEREDVVVTGPPARIAFDAEGKPTKAGLGFAKSQNVAMEDVFVQNTGKGEYLAVHKTVGGAPAKDILGQICQELIAHLPFPKKMHWEKSRFTFGRPLRWFLALLDSDVVPFELAGLAAGNQTFGHRVLGPGPFVVKHAEDYASVIAEQGKVVLAYEDRVAKIVTQGNTLAAEVGGNIVWNDGLTRHVANLVEYPCPVLGKFDEKYLELPAEVLLTSMETHQKSFGVRGEDGKLLPYFLTVINLEPESVDLVRKGWERVLRARLDDAMFFWKADLRRDVDTWLTKLDKVTFLGPLGSMGDKSRRLQRLAGLIATDLQPDLTADMQRAGRLAKADLVSEMVYEFDDLQGIMGGIYALKKGESKNVADALYEHYLPSGQNSECPKTVAGAILAMADKLDTLAGCFGIGKIPTGAADPLALRRCTLGVCRIILEHGFRVDIATLLGMALEGYQHVTWKYEPDLTLTKLMDFFAQRLRNYWAGKGLGTKVLDAAIGAGVHDMVALEKCLQALTLFSEEPDFGESVLTFKRADNIIRKQGDAARDALTGTVDVGLLEEEAEKTLHAQLVATKGEWDRLWEADDFAGLLGQLRTLRPFVDGFFDTVMVMCEDENLRTNRLNMLYSLVRRLGRLADFSAFQV
ncbi:MAG: glycine--tRNA ligase subunit beta [Desulfoplanes sp.]